VAKKDFSGWIQDTLMEYKFLYIKAVYIWQINVLGKTLEVRTKN